MFDCRSRVHYGGIGYVVAVAAVRVLQQVTIQFVFGVVGLFPDHGCGTFIKLRTRIDAINLLIPDDKGRRLMSSYHRVYMVVCGVVYIIL